MPIALSVMIAASVIVCRLADEPLHKFFRDLLCKRAKPVRTNAAEP